MRNQRRFQAAVLLAAMTVLLSSRQMDARLVPDGEYEWRVLETQGFTARCVATLGVHPSSRVPEALFYQPTP